MLFLQAIHTGFAVESVMYFFVNNLFFKGVGFGDAETSERVN